MTVNGESCRAVEINGKIYHSVQEMIERIVDLEKTNEWHDLRKDPTDLPERFRKSSYSKTVVNQIGTPCHYNYELQCWQNWSFITIETPFAWCKIPTFDKE